MKVLSRDWAEVWGVIKAGRGLAGILRWVAKLGIFILDLATWAWGGRAGSEVGRARAGLGEVGGRSVYGGWARTGE